MAWLSGRQFPVSVELEPLKELCSEEATLPATKVHAVTPSWKSATNACVNCAECAAQGVVDRIGLAWFETLLILLLQFGSFPYG